MCSAGDTECAAALHYNSQYGGQLEYLYITASDQARAELRGLDSNMRVCPRACILKNGGGTRVRDRTAFRGAPACFLRCPSPFSSLHLPPLSLCTPVSPRPSLFLARSDRFRSLSDSRSSTLTAAPRSCKPNPLYLPVLPAGGQRRSLDPGPARGRRATLAWTARKRSPILRALGLRSRLVRCSKA